MRFPFFASAAAAILHLALGTHILDSIDQDDRDGKKEADIRGEKKHIDANLIRTAEHDAAAYAAALDDKEIAGMVSSVVAAVQIRAKSHGGHASALGHHTDAHSGASHYGNNAMKRGSPPRSLEERITDAAAIAAAVAKEDGKSKEEMQKAAERAAESVANGNEGDDVPSDSEPVADCGFLCADDEESISAEVAKAKSAGKGPDDVANTARETALVLGACPEQVERYGEEARADAQATILISKTMEESQPLISSARKEAAKAKKCQKLLAQDIHTLMQQEREAQAEVEEQEVKEAEKIITIKEKKAKLDLQAAKAQLTSAMQKSHPNATKADKEDCVQKRATSVAKEAAKAAAAAASSAGAGADTAKIAQAAGEAAGKAAYKAASVRSCCDSDSAESEVACEAVETALAEGKTPEEVATAMKAALTKARDNNVNQQREKQDQKKLDDLDSAGEEASQAALSSGGSSSDADLARQAAMEAKATATKDESEAMQELKRQNRELELKLQASEASAGARSN